jgi:N-acetylglucosamine-6-sulfatase
MLKKLCFFLAFISLHAVAQTASKKPKNIIFILADDHRYDAMGFMNKVPWLKTPNMDKMARQGVHVKNAFVSTALCSPSRASILTGQYPHTHTIVDNFAPLPKGLKFFPEYLQKAGYKTAFMGKWHMGNTDDAPQPGFDYWLSFKGQGIYTNPTFNINGKQVAHKDSSYISDLLTNYALDWMGSLDKSKPFCLYLSHKGVHAEFQPAKRHKGMYKDKEIPYPRSMYLTKSDTSKIWGKIPELPADYKYNMKDMPQWVKNQRYSWHGVDFLYHGYTDFNSFYRNYLETLAGVDDSIGNVMDWLKKNNLEENTIVIYMGDNGFSMGERGLIDKRHAYEESMRVPMLVHAPGIAPKGSVIEEVIQNIDIAPTLLDYAGVAKPAQMQGNSFLPLIKGQKIPWTNRMFYEYFWEFDFPQTPTMFAVRTKKYKYIFNQGVWDANELYDLDSDPDEVNNLIRSKEHQEIAKGLRGELMDWLEKTGGLQIPLKKMNQKRNDHVYQGNY